MEPDNSQPIAPLGASTDAGVKTHPSDGNSPTPAGMPVKTRPSDGETPEPVSSVERQESNEMPQTSAPVTPTTQTSPAPIATPVASPLTTEPLGSTTPASGHPSLEKEGMTIQEKLEAARVAMEGPDRSAERIKRQTEAKVEEETAELSEEKAELDKKKEKLEIAWIDLDSKRGVFKKELDPILAEEEKIENEDKSAQTEEEATALPAQKQVAEKKRQEKDTARKAIEEKKWVIQDKIAKLEVQIEENTKQYQTLLDDEEKILQKIDELKKELI